MSSALTGNTGTTPTGGTTGRRDAGHDVPVGSPIPQTAADRFMRRLLRLPPDPVKASAAAARSAFRTSILVATVRCLLMYIVFPFVLPAVGFWSDIGPVIGFAINLVAIVCIVMSMRRFWRVNHPKRWWYTAVGGTVFVLLVGLGVADVVTLLT